MLKLCDALRYKRHVVMRTYKIIPFRLYASVLEQHRVHVHNTCALFLPRLPFCILFFLLDRAT